MISDYPLTIAHPVLAPLSSADRAISLPQMDLLPSPAPSPDFFNSSFIIYKRMKYPQRKTTSLLTPYPELGLQGVNKLSGYKSKPCLFLLRSEMSSFIHLSLKGAEHVLPELGSISFWDRKQTGWISALEIILAMCTGHGKWGCYDFSAVIIYGSNYINKGNYIPLQQFLSYHPHE